MSSTRPHTPFLTGHVGADILPEDGPATLVTWSQTGIPVESYNKGWKEELSIWKHLLGSYFWSKATSYSKRGRNVLCFKIVEY